MKLYAVTWYAAPEKKDCVVWVGTQSERDRLYREKRKDLESEDAQKHDFDVPTSKPELLAWLNEHAVGV